MNQRCTYRFCRDFIMNTKTRWNKRTERQLEDHHPPVVEGAVDRSSPFGSLKKMMITSMSVIVLMLVFITAVQAQSGTAFRDFNGDGLQTGAEPGVEGIIVKLYGNAVFPAKDVLIGEAVTGSNGTYDFSVTLVSGRAALPGENLRVEFEIPDQYGCDLDKDVDFIGLNGGVYGTSVQFIEGQQTNINFAINYPGQWVNTSNPDVYVPIYTFGDPLLAGSAAAEPGLVTFKFDDSGVPASYSGGNAGVPEPTELASNAEVGALYGIAFSRQAQKVFASAVMRRHCGFGPLGPGGIYLVDPYSGAADKTEDWLDLDAIGIFTNNNAGSYPANPGNNTSPVSDYIGTNAERGLPSGLTTPSTDYAAGDQVGKVSIGDIDISDDGRYLYILNLYDRKIYEIDLVDPINPQAPTAADVATRVRSWDVPDPGTNANQGEHRPWGLKYYRGKLYVGVVLSQQDINGNVVGTVSGSGNSQIGDELRGYVYDFDPLTEMFDVKLDFSFNYGRERPWIPWGYRSGYPSRYFSANEREVAEPIISDIEFDDQGNMLVGVLDRKGHQYGIYNNNYAGTLDPVEYASAGELLRANLDASCDMFTIVTAPGTTDYYQDNFAHPESLQGPLAVLPGGGDALAIVLDPIQIRSGGTVRFNNDTGAPVGGSRYEIFDDRHTLSSPDAVPSKANGLGDIELAGVAAPIEIGNLVWMDVDTDGVQDGGEPGIAGVTVELLDASMNVIASTMTDANGGYYFNHSNVMDPSGPSTVQGPLPFTSYKVRISPTQFSSGIGTGPLHNMVLTSTDQAGNGLADRSDSDAALAGGEAQIMLMTNAPGQNDHSFDFGFLVFDYGDLPDTYVTEDGSGGPRHQLDPRLFIGTCVDAEIDGQPDPMAGMMSGGDDNNTINASLPIGEACSNDEDGISFSTSLVPGNQACVEVSVVNTTGAMAKLQGWIDFDGNGMFNGADELNTGDFAGGGVMIPAAGVTNVEYCFDVPAGATFSTGSTELYSRFRLSENGNLGSGGINPDGSVPIGEVEDHKQPLAMLGDYVWIDADYDGVQDMGETPVEGTTATLHDCTGGTPGAVLGSMQTDASGYYKFIGLIDGEYCVCFDLTTSNHPRANDMEFTVPNNSANDDDDSDADEISGCTPGVTLTAGDDYPDLDAGVFIPGKLGDIVWEDVNGNGVQDPGEPGIPNAKATLTGTDGAGNNVTVGPIMTDGVGMYMFGDLKPGTYKVTFMAPDGSNFVPTAVNDPSGNGTDASDSDADPNNMLMSHVVTVVSGTEDLTIDAGFFEPAKIGNIVWQDWDNDGEQDPGEPGIGGVQVTLTGTDGLGNTVPAQMATTDGTGMFMFPGLWPGDYKLTFATPADMQPTKANEGGVADAADSDADPANGGMTTLTFLESGEYDDTWDAGYFATDYGDMPDTYGTTEGANGPKHLIFPDLIIGACVDGELDGQDDPMAGMMAPNGDDNNASAVSHPAGANCTDDEDGVTLVTPMVPGYEACFEVDVVNGTGAAAVLQAWVDFDGDGSVAGEELTTGDFAGGGVTVPVAGLNDAVVCFDVPATTVFSQGNAFVRFRLSRNGGLSATGVNADGSIPQGEVEDYKIPLAKVGNLVWEDRNYNGIQEPGIDVGLNGFPIDLMWVGLDGMMGTGDDVTYSTVSAQVTYPGAVVKDGVYTFCGLIAGDYKLTVTTDRFATLLNVGDDYLDSDDENGELFTITDVLNMDTGENGLNDMAGMMNPVDAANSFPDNQDDISYDFGYAGFDYGDLPQTFVTLEDDPAMPGMEGPRHLFTPNWFMGICMDIDLDGQPDQYAGFYPTSAGDDNTPGLASLPANVVCDDDENGVILKTELLPGYEACFDVMTTGPEAGVMQAWIDFDGSGDFAADGSEAVIWSSSGTAEAAIPAGANVITELCFVVPANATFPNIETHMRFRFSDQGGLDYKNGYADGSYPFGEVEDYYQPLAEIGDLIWHDIDGDGVQDPGEPGVPGVTVEIHDCTDPNNPQVLATTTTDANGFYEFIGLIPMEKYCIHFDETTATDGNANDYVFTFKDSPNIDATDANDSDVDSEGWAEPVMMMDRERNETIDAGVYIPVSIGNFVWLDYDEDGEQDPDEPVIEGAKLFLSGTNNIGEDIPGGAMMVPDGQPIPQTMLMTDANGEYLFTGLAPGTYKITFDISMITGPEELVRFAQLLVFTFQDATIDPEDSDVDPGDYDSPVGMSGFYTLLSGDQDLTVDGGVMVPCLPPTDIYVDMVMETTAIIHWTVNNEILDINTNAHCWNIAIGNYGFEPWNNEAVQLITVCADDPDIVINGDQVSYMVEDLAAGTCYDVYVQEGCNGEIPPTATHGWVNAPGTPQIGDILGNPLLATDTNPDGLCTFDYPHIVTKSATPPECPWGSENYIANGTLTVVIEDSPSCGPSTFTITVTPVAGSTPGGTTPVAVSDSYIDVPAGSYTYTDLDAGEYHVSVLETGPCRPKVNPVEMTQEVPNAIDTEGPDKFVTDILGNEVTNIGPFILPEGSCDYQMQLYVQAIDGCYGFITAEDAVSVTATMIPGTVFPGTQASVVDDGFGNYLIDVTFAAGTTELTITVEDPDGNPTSMTYTVVVEEFTNPDVSIVGIDNITIPHCADSRDISFTVYVDDLCDQLVDFDNLTVCVYDLDDLANPTCLDPDDTFPLGGGELPGDGNGYGVYTLEVTPDMDGNYIEAFYTDPQGNVGVVTVQLTVDQAAADEPGLVYAADENMTIPYCEDTVPFCYSFQVYDDCAPVDIDYVIDNFNQDGMGLELDWVDDTNPNFVYFAYCGEIAPGTYFPEIYYNDAIQPDAQPLVIINQQQNQAPDITLPGNLNFTIPVCEDELVTTLGIYIQDDCDDATDDFTINFLGATFPGLLNWEWVDNGYIELLVQLTPGTHFIGMEVTDSDGATTYTDAQLTVTGQPDTWAPVLVYPSQDFDIALDACEDPEVEVCFYVSAYDNCDENVAPTVMMDGQVLTAVGDDKYCVTVTPGDYQIDVSATDNSDNSSLETFTINVTQEEAPEDNLACIATVYATLEGDCSVELVASMVLNGEWSCLTDDDFDVVVMDDNPDNGAIIDGCGTFNYMITIADGVEANFEVCWGEVTSEDKTSPEIDCPDPTDHSLTSGEEFICTDIESILLDGVHYYTTYADGTIVPGSINAVLAWILGETGYPEVSDNCGQLRVAVWDELEESDCGYDVITRHFEVSDRYNSDCTGAPMTASCTQTISVRKPDIDDVDMPEDIVEIECSDEVAVTDDGYPHPSVTGYPSVTTAYGTYDLAATYCNLGAAYEDSDPIIVCESTYKIIRTWSIVDWCVVPAHVTEYTQIIKVEDTTPPAISCNWEDTDWDGHPDMPVYSTGPFDCTAAFQVAAPTVTDNCSDYVWYVDVVIRTEVNTYDQWGQVTGTAIVDQGHASYGPFGSSESGPYVSGVPMSVFGNHYLHYTVIDGCDNTSTYDCEFAVEDKINPVAICDDDLNISIGSDGYARVYAEDIDEGSNDNCQLTHIEVRRAGGEWGDYVDFDCEDVHEFVTIELRVWDAAGNSNLCWLEVLIEDKITPYCHAPHSVSMHCDDHELLHIDWDNADQLDEVFGAAWAEDNCNATAEQIAVSNNLNDCGWGTVVRTFQATDDWGLTSTNACTQVITIYEVHNYEIKFPKDASAECGVPNPDTLEYNTLGCDLITVNVNDEIYEATSDECYKILRTYKVINWCEWDGESDPIVIGRDEDCDNDPGDEDVWVMVRTEWNGDDPIFTAYVDRDNDETNTNPFIGTSRCTSLPKPYGHWANSTINTELTSVGHWQYTQVIKIYDFVAPTAVVHDYTAFCSETADCNGDVLITVTVEELCDLDVVLAYGFIDAFADGTQDGAATVVEVARDEAAGTITYEISGNYPIGGHSFGLHIEDGCHNITWLEIPFEVVDCKAPTPVCINGLTVTLMPQPDGCCAMAIWATDFIASPNEDCTGPIEYSIHRADDVADGSDIPSPENTGLVLDCEDDETVTILIYSWDSAYNPYAVQPDGSIGGPNYDYCETYLLVQAHADCAEPILSNIAGTVQTEEAEGVEGTEVLLSGVSSDEEVTIASGSYVFNVVQNGFDYTVTPHLDENPLNGVTTFDLVLITKHILGIQILDSPYKMIAADANSSGSITTADMIQLRKLILGIYTDFPNNTSWRFVDADYVFPDATNPWYEEFPESRNINNLSEDMMSEDFIAAKIGDVNGSATPNATVIEERNVNGLFTLQTEDLRLEAGEQYTVNFTAADLDKIQGYQFTMNFDRTALSFAGMEYGVAQAENFGLTYADEGMITSSWNLPGGQTGAANGQTLKGDEILFSVVFTAQLEADLSEVISIGSRITRAEAYNVSNELLDVAMSFNTGADVADVFEVYQNTPNPFAAETNIGYNLPEDAAVTITIQDVTGRTIQVMHRDGMKGYNIVTLDAETLGATGTMYYTVATDKYVATKKMILVK